MNVLTDWALHLSVICVSNEKFILFRINGDVAIKLNHSWYNGLKNQIGLVDKSDKIYFTCYIS